MSRSTTVLAFALLFLALCIPARSAPIPQPAPSPLPAPAAVDPIADALASKLAAISKQLGRRPVPNPKWLPSNPKFTGELGLLGSVQSHDLTFAFATGQRLTRKSSIAIVAEPNTAASTVTAAPVVGECLFGGAPLTFRLLTPNRSTATKAVLMKRWPPTEAPTGSGGAGVFTPIWAPVKIAPPGRNVNPKWTGTVQTTTSAFIPPVGPIKVGPSGGGGGAVPGNPKDTKARSSSASTFKPTSTPIKVLRSSAPVKIWTGVNTAPTTHPGNPHPYPSRSK